MNYSGDFRYMSIIDAIADVNNTFLSRREITCNFAGLSGRLNKLDATDMITKEFKLDGKLVIPIKLKNHVGKSLVTGTFFVYDDEKLAKSHVNPTIFTRLEKAKTARTEKESKESAAAEEVKEEEVGETKTDEKLVEEKKEEEKSE